MYIRVHATPGFEQMCIRLLAPARKGGSDFLAGATVLDSSPLLSNAFNGPPLHPSGIPSNLQRRAERFRPISHRPPISYPLVLPPPSLGKGARAVSLSRGNNASPEPPLRFSPIERREEEGEAWTWTRARTRAGETLERRKWRRQPLTC